MRCCAMLLACLMLVACGGLGKPRPERASFDFGLTPLSSATFWPTLLAVADIDAPSGLNDKGIRYRLAYREPSRIYTYTLSQWAAAPTELLTRRLRQATGGQTGGASCSLQITLETFDHVFKAADTSYGMVRVHAVIVERKRRTAIVHNTFSRNAPALTQDAQGGVAALTVAADAALQDVIAWVATASVAGELGACVA